MALIGRYCSGNCRKQALRERVSRAEAERKVEQLAQASAAVATTRQHSLTWIRQPDSSKPSPRQPLDTVALIGQLVPAQDSR
jgi:hypothetical protein